MVEWNGDFFKLFLALKTIYSKQFFIFEEYLNPQSEREWRTDKKKKIIFQLITRLPWVGISFYKTKPFSFVLTFGSFSFFLNLFAFMLFHQPHIIIINYLGLGNRYVFFSFFNSSVHLLWKIGRRFTILIKSLEVGRVKEYKKQAKAKQKCRIEDDDKIFIFRIRNHIPLLIEHSWADTVKMCEEVLWTP